MNQFLPVGAQPHETHQDWVRLRTLIYLRWTAIVGQLAAILVAWCCYDIALDLGLCLMTVGAAVAANLVSIFLFPENKRLTETEAMVTLLFDTAQLALLLALTGGLNNPFALLILVPVTIAATALQKRPTILLGLAQSQPEPLAQLTQRIAILRWLALQTELGFYEQRATDVDERLRVAQNELALMGTNAALPVSYHLEATSPGYRIDR